MKRKITLSLIALASMIVVIVVGLVVYAAMFRGGTDGILETIQEVTLVCPPGQEKAYSNCSCSFVCRPPGNYADCMQICP